MLEIWLEFEHTSECRFSSEYFRKANSHAVKWNEVKWLSWQHFPFYSLCWKDIELLIDFIFITSAVWWKKKKTPAGHGLDVSQTLHALPFLHLSLRHTLSLWYVCSFSLAYNFFSFSLSLSLTHALSLSLTVSLSLPCLFPYTGMEGGGRKRTSGHPNLEDSLRKRGEEVRPQC